MCVDLLVKTRLQHGGQAWNSGGERKNPKISNKHPFLQILLTERDYLEAEPTTFFKQPGFSPKLAPCSSSLSFSAQ